MWFLSLKINSKYNGQARIRTLFLNTCHTVFFYKLTLSWVDISNNSCAVLAHFCGHCSQAFHLLLLLGDWNYFYLESRLKTPAVLKENSPFEASLVTLWVPGQSELYMLRPCLKKQNKEKSQGKSFYWPLMRTSTTSYPFCMKTCVPFLGSLFQFTPERKAMKLFRLSPVWWASAVGGGGVSGRP